MAIIYKSTNMLTGSIYIGKSQRPLNFRKSDHISTAKRGSRYHFHRALRKYGYNNFIWETLETIPNDLAGQVEKAWISVYTLLGLKLYNETIGGEGFFSGHSDETKLKISQAKKGKPAHNRGVPVKESAKEKQRKFWQLRREAQHDHA